MIWLAAKKSCVQYPISFSFYKSNQVQDCQFPALYLCSEHRYCSAVHWWWMMMMVMMIMVMVVMVMVMVGWDYWPIDLISNLFWIRCISPNSAGLWFKSAGIGSLLKGQADKKTLLDINFNIAFAANAYEDDDDNSDDDVENTSRCTRTSTGQTPGQMRSQSVTSLGWAGIFVTCIR